VRSYFFYDGVDKSELAFDEKTIAFVFSKICKECKDLDKFQKLKRHFKKNLNELSLKFCNDSVMRAYNKQYRKIDKATDVISFPSFEIFDYGENDHQSFGDLILSTEALRRRAKSRGITYKNNFLQTLIHGWLHLLGYDHQNSKQRLEMFSLQEQLFVKLKKAIKDL